MNTLRFPVLTLTLIFASLISLHAEDFDYGPSDLSPHELYDEALKHLYGTEGYKVNKGAAMSRLRKAADASYAPAHNLLGLLHLEGNLFFNSPRKALRSFEAAAALGDTLGRYNAAYSYLSGRGVRADMEKAARLFHQVADKASASSISPEDFAAIRRARASAYFFLGIIYADEKDTAHFDDAKANEMFHQADELNEPSAAMLLAIRYARGEGAEQDQAKSKHYLERYKLAAVNQLHNSFQQVLFQGMEKKEVKETIAKLVGNYEDEMGERIRSMQTSFGVSLLDEEDLYDPEQAYVWLEPVATKDNPLASSRLALLIYHGHGVSADPAQAREYLESSYRRNSMAKYNLAVMLAQGLGGSPDFERAQKLMNQAKQESWYPAQHYGSDLMNAPLIHEREARKLVEEEAAKENPFALYCLGRRTLFGIGVDQNIPLASEQLKQAMRLGSEHAAYFYGVFLANDVKLLWEATEEEKAIKTAADAGYPPAIHHLARDKEYKNNYDEARLLYEKAAKMEHAPSLCALGRIYRDGLGVKIDRNKAFSYFQSANELEDAVGALYSGYCYEFGIGVEQDLGNAFDSYQLAVDLGSTYANLALGNLLASGKLGKQAWEEAVPYWEKAANDRVTDANLKLGKCYLYGTGVEKNASLAQNYFYAAQNSSYYGNDDVEYHLALLKLDEQADSHAPKAGLQSLRFLEMDGYPQAGYQLALMNLNGEVLKQNSAKAYNKFLKAAQSLGPELASALGNEYSNFYNENVTLAKSSQPVDHESEEVKKVGADAAYQIARLIEAGHVKRTNAKQSLVWYQAAAQAGQSDAQLQLGKLYLEGKYTEKSRTEAWRWINQSATLSSEAKYLSAESWFEGENESIDEETATKWLREAALSNHHAALELLEEKGIALDPDAIPSSNEPSDKEGKDDGFEGPIDVDVA